MTTGGAAADIVIEWRFDFRYWPKADITIALTNVRYWG